MTAVINFCALTDWVDVVNAARVTVHRENTEKTPSAQWQHKLLLSEHSPARVLQFSWTWVDLPYWVSVHLVRHKIGIEHFVRTQRTDRTGVRRDELPQGAPVEHSALANAQAIINISRKRLCLHAAPETRYAWELVLRELKSVYPAVYSACVPECIYRGFCPEFDACAYIDAPGWVRRLNEYRNGRSDA